MRIDLEELRYPESRPIPCAFCERPVRMDRLGDVIARAVAAGRTDCGEVCAECADYLSRGPMAATGKFPALTP